MSKTRRRQIRRSNQENSSEQVTETSNASKNGRNVSQNGRKFGPTLSGAEVDAMIRNAVERELIKFGNDRNQNNARTEVAQSGSKINNLLIDNNEQPDFNGSHAPHFIVNNGNNDRNGSREHNYADPAAQARQAKTGLDTVNCHTRLSKLSISYDYISLLRPCPTCQQLHHVQFSFLRF